MSKHFEFAYNLLRSGVDLDVNTPDLLGRTPLISSLVNFDITSSIQTPFQKKLNSYIANMLIERGAAVNGESPFYYSPLEWAITNDYDDVIPLLIQKGARSRLTFEEMMKNSNRDKLNSIILRGF